MAWVLDSPLDPWLLGRGSRPQFLQPGVSVVAVGIRGGPRLLLLQDGSSSP